MSILNNTQVVDRTEAINLVKPIPQLISSLGLFKAAPVATNVIQFDYKEDTFNILSDKQRNTVGKNVMTPESYQLHSLPIPHYPVENSLTYTELSGIRGFGIDTERTIETAVADELERQSLRHDIHNEYLRAAMLLNGQVVTTHFGTIDVYNEFGVTRQTEAINMGSGVLSGFLSATQKAKRGLKNGSQVRGYICLCGASFFNQMINTAEVKAAYTNSQSNGNPLRNELWEAMSGYTVFRYGNIDFVLYTDEFTDGSGLITILDHDKAVLFPRATLGNEWYGPVSKLSGIGASGAKRFASSYRDPKDRFVDVESEQNTLVLTTQCAASVLITVA